MKSPGCQRLANTLQKCLLWVRFPPWTLFDSVAQWMRALAYEASGCRFESYQNHHVETMRPVKVSQ